jgi:hypothetical protein
MPIALQKFADARITFEEASNKHPEFAKIPFTTAHKLEKPGIIQRKVLKDGR